MNHLRGNCVTTRDILIDVLVDEGKARVVSSRTSHLEDPFMLDLLLVVVLVMLG